MATKTDPARELADVCKALNHPDPDSGDIFLSSQFKVEAWSREFFEIIFSILDRCEVLRTMLATLNMDDDHVLEATAHISQIESAFSKTSLNNAWSQRGYQHLNGSGAVSAISMLSRPVRDKISYPKLSQQEIDELVADMDELLAWLVDIQLNDKVFIRAALIVGLKTFRVRLARVGWLGWEYTTQGLREVGGAYLALERGFPDPSANPTAAAIMKKVGDFAGKFWAMTGHARDTYDTAEMILALYGLYHGAQATGIAGLLT